MNARNLWVIAAVLTVAASAGAITRPSFQFLSNTPFENVMVHGAIA